jgi:hypothetical protein
MPTFLSDSCHKKSPHWAHEYAKATSDNSKWNYRRPSQTKRERCLEWAGLVKPQYELDSRLARVFLWCHRPRFTFGWTVSAANSKASTETNRLRSEFAVLAAKWRRETKFSSSLDEKVLHSAYQSIIAMGRSAVPLVLEELEARRGHWFWALHFMTGAEPIPEGANIEEARDAWLRWGRQEGYLE